LRYRSLLPNLAASALLLLGALNLVAVPRIADVKDVARKRHAGARAAEDSTSVGAVRSHCAGSSCLAVARNDMTSIRSTPCHADSLHRAQ